MGRVQPLPDAVAVTSLVLATTGGVLTAVAIGDVLTALLQSVAYSLAFGAVGWVLWRRLPANPIGWCFSGSALASAVSWPGHGWAALAMTGRVEHTAFSDLCALVDTNIWVVSAVLGVCLPLLLLPDGRLPSARWSRAAWLLLAGCVIGLAGVATEPGPLGPGSFDDVVNPLGVAALGALPGLLAPVAPLTVLLGTLAGVAALVVRYRPSSGVERQQLRWVALGGGCALLGIAASAPAPDQPVGLVAGVVAANALPVAIGVAVLRYRLYDLGRLVSRTVSYAVLSSLLLGIYVAVVSAASRVVPTGSSLAVAASTLAAAALFQPLRVRVQRVVDSRFNRAHYDTERTVAEFTRTLREQVDLDTVRRDLLRVVDGAVQPAAVGLWLRDSRWPAAPLALRTGAVVK